MIHPLAHVENSEVGAHTKVWQFASVIRGAVVGSDCNIGSTAIVDGARLGDRVLVGHGAFIGPGVVVGNDVFLAPGVMLCNDAWPRVEKTGFDFEKLISGEFVTVRIEDGASLGARVVVLPGVTIGFDAMIAAGVVVEKNVPPRNLLKRDGTMATIDMSCVTQRMREAA